MGLPIELPPLRERGNDILILAKYFLDEFSKGNNLGIVQLSKEAKDKLLQYYFPGNVRELKAIIELAAVLCENNVIKFNDIVYTHTKKGNISIAEQKTLRAHTQDIVNYYLKQNNNEINKTAKLLDIGKSTIYKMKQDGELN